MAKRDLFFWHNRLTPQKPMCHYWSAKSMDVCFAAGLHPEPGGEKRNKGKQLVQAQIYFVLFGGWCDAGIEFVYALPAAGSRCIGAPHVLRSRSVDEPSG
jgi:hypothetical protein